MTESAPPDVRDAGPRPAMRALVLDLDGTCLDAHDQSLHPRTRDAVRAAARRMPVIVATGRMYRSARPWCLELGVTAPVVCYQGALVRELGGDTAVLLDVTLDGAAALRAIEIARANDWHVQAYRDDVLLCEQDRPEAHLYARIAQVPITFVPDLAAVVARGSTKVVCVIEDEQEVQRCRREMRAALDGVARVTWSLPQFVEIVDPRVSKAAACALVCARLGVPLQEAVAVGDAANDVDVLDAAGFAVVVRGAASDVLEHADATCAPPSEAGVADAIESLLPQAGVSR